MGELPVERYLKGACHLLGKLLHLSRGHRLEGARNLGVLADVFELGHADNRRSDRQ